MRPGGVVTANESESDEYVKGLECFQNWRQLTHFGYSLRYDLFLPIETATAFLRHHKATGVGPSQALVNLASTYDNGEIVSRDM
jgi:hypothetical protein